MPHLLTLAFVLLLALTPSRAHAQVINVLPLLSGKPQDGLHMEATGGGSLLTGNVPFLTARGRLLLRYRTGRHTLISSSTAEFGRGGGDPFLNRQITHLRYQNRLSDVVVWEAFGQATHDLVWRLKLRALGGTGLRFDLQRSETVDLVLGLGYLFEHERLSRGAEFGDSGLIRNNHRLASYTTMAWRIDPPLSLIQTVFFQPRLDAFTDFRLLSHSALVVKVKEKLAISTTLQIAYYSWQPETILPLDTTTGLEFTVAF